jgi:hypothetical protein
MIVVDAPIVVTEPAPIVEIVRPAPVVVRRQYAPSVIVTRPSPVIVRGGSRVVVHERRGFDARRVDGRRVVHVRGHR